jgi:hypothetical protein
MGDGVGDAGDLAWDVLVIAPESRTKDKDEPRAKGIGGEIKD